MRWTFPGNAGASDVCQQGTNHNLHHSNRGGAVSTPETYIGNSFGGCSIDVADPDAASNAGNDMGLVMWVYIWKITGTHTLYCR